jgi:hypothetical protein
MRGFERLLQRQSTIPQPRRKPVFSSRRKMRNQLIATTVALLCANAMAGTEGTAANIVKRYSEAIACQISDTKEQKLQYKTVKVQAGHSDLGGLGDIFVVFWEGDVGCAGGRGTVVPNFTVVEQRGFTSVPPVVVPGYKMPDLDLVHITALSGKNGILQVSGVTYGPTDQQGSPSKKVSYTLKLDLANERFVKR